MASVLLVIEIALLLAAGCCKLMEDAGMLIVYRALDIDYKARWGIVSDYGHGDELFSFVDWKWHPLHMSEDGKFYIFTNE